MFKIGALIVWLCIWQICFVLSQNLEESMRLIGETKNIIYRRFSLSRVDQQLFFLGIANMDMYVKLSLLSNCISRIFIFILGMHGVS